jgi:pimeloyl-ACP methyl ester carboxylesterase
VLYRKLFESYLESLKKICFIVWLSTVSFPGFLQAAFPAALPMNEILPTMYSRSSYALDPKLTDVHFFFVGGFLNEGIFGYFKDNIVALKLAGVKADFIHDPFLPPSQSDFETNAEYLAYEIHKMVVNKSIHRFVLMGHSKGGLESLVATLRHYDWFSDQLLATILIQGAIKGSEIANCIQNYGGEECPEVSRYEIPLLAKTGFVLSWAFGSLLAPALKDGLSSLRVDRLESFWNEEKPNLKKFLKEVNVEKKNRIFFVTSLRDPNRVSPLLEATAQYLQAHSGANDGLVPLARQSIDELGVVIGNLEADHADLTVPSPVSTRYAEYRYAFTWSVLEFLKSL